MKRIFAVCLIFCMGVMPVMPKDKIDVVPRGNWALVESLGIGERISVHMVFGDKMEGKFLGLDASAIRLKISGQERVYPRNSITEIWQLRVPDRKLNGILIGMAAGAAVGFPIAAANGAYSEGGDTAGKQLAGAIALAGTGIGALLGLTVDVLIKGNKLLYRK